LQRGGPAAAGEPVVVGEAGEELVLPGRLGRLLRSGRLENEPVDVAGLPAREMPRLVGRGGAEQMVPEVDSEVVAHHDLARLRATPVGAELIRLAIDAPRNIDTTRMLATGTVGLGAMSVQQSQSQQPMTARTEVNIIDQRQAGAPPVEAQRSTGPDGREVVNLIVRDAVMDMHRRGDLGELLRQDFGIRPRAR
jgi:hypothetical protein